MYFRMMPFFGIHISQGSLATRLKRGGIFKQKFVANLLPSRLVKKIWNRIIVSEVMAKSLVVSCFFDSRCRMIYDMTWNSHFRHISPCLTCLRSIFSTLLARGQQRCGLWLPLTVLQQLVITSSVVYTHVQLRPRVCASVSPRTHPSCINCRHRSSCFHFCGPAGRGAASALSDRS